MATTTEQNYSFEIKEALKLEDVYNQFLLAKNAYKSRNVGMGNALLDSYRKSYQLSDTEIFTNYVLYAAFNEMMQQFLNQHLYTAPRVSFSKIPVPEYIRIMANDMKHLDYPLNKVIRDVEKHHCPQFPIPFLDDVLLEESVEHMRM